MGYLGGSGGEEVLPALPGAEDPGTYSHRDFMGGEADPHGGSGDYSDPYALPPESSPYNEYEGYDTAAMADADPSYFDSMGHDDEVDTGIATAPVGYETEEFEDDDQPKTISQQDAESIIRRITTKRILPPETQPQPLTPTRLTSGGGGLRVWPILLAIVLLLAGGIYMFRIPIAEAEWAPEWLSKLLGHEVEEAPEVEKVEVKDPEEVKKNNMLKKVMLSESMAMGVDPKPIKTGEGDATKPKGEK